MFKIFLLFILSCSNSDSTTSNSSSSSSGYVVESFFMKEDDTPVEENESCIFNDLKTRVRVTFSEVPLNILPVGSISVNNNFFSCTNCKSLEISKINNTTYDIFIEPTTDTNGTNIEFATKAVFITESKQSYQVNKSTCTITNIYTSPIIEEPTNIKEMFINDFQEITTPSEFFLEMPPVQTQKGGSCVAFASSNAFSYELWKSLKKPRQPQNQKADYSNSAISPYFSYILGRLNDQSPSCKDAIGYNDAFTAFTTLGSPLYSALPKSSLDDKCMSVLTNEVYENALSQKAWEVVKIDLENLSLVDFIKVLKGALFSDHPLIFSVLMTDNFTKIKNNAPLWKTEGDVNRSAGHAMVITGYQDNYKNSGKTVFQFFNSWGPNFGIDGYAYIEASALKEKISKVMIVLAKDRTIAVINPSAEYNFQNNLNSTTNQHNGSGSLNYIMNNNKTVANFTNGNKVSLNGSFNFTKGYSVSMWIKPTEADSEKVLISQIAGNIANTIGFEVGIKNKRIFVKSIENNTIETTPLSDPSLEISTTEWNHIVATWDTSSIKVYLNKELVLFKPMLVGSNIQPNIQSVVLGVKSMQNSQNQYIGLMSNVKIYEGTLLETCLTSLNVEALYDEGF